MVQFRSGTQVYAVFDGVNRIAAVKTVASVATTYYVHTDHVGSTSLITTSSGGQYRKEVYKSYGEVFKAWKSSEGWHEPYTTDLTDIGNYAFTGQELDTEIGLYYYGARYYDSFIGRFISADTEIDGKGLDTQGYNRYSYARNNPITYNDPSGNKWSWKGFWRIITGFVDVVVGIAVTVIGSLILSAALISGDAPAVFGGYLIMTWGISLLTTWTEQNGGSARVDITKTFYIDSPFGGSGGADNKKGGRDFIGLGGKVKKSDTDDTINTPGSAPEKSVKTNKKEPLNSAASLDNLTKVKKPKVEIDSFLDALHESFRDKEYGGVDDVYISERLITSFRDDPAMIEVRLQVKEAIEKGDKSGKIRNVEFGGKTTKWASMEVQGVVLAALARLGGLVGLGYSALLFTDTWKVALQQNTWLVRHADVRWSLLKSGKIHYSFEDTFDLKKHDGQSAYNYIVIPLGYIYHDILQGNRNLKIHGNWSE